MSLSKEPKIRNYIGIMLIAVVLFSSGCLDLAVIGVSAAIRDAQNQKRIEQEREIDAQRQDRDRALHHQIQLLQKQNEVLLQQGE